MIINNPMKMILRNSYGRQIVNEETEYLAQIIRHQRYKYNYTLDEASRGICCVSYYSKLENLNVPVIRSDFLPLICERLEIGDDLRESFVKVEVLSSAFKAYYTQKYERLLEIYDSMHVKYFTAGSGIISCLYFLIKNDFKSCRDVFDSLEIIKGSMKFIEAALFIYVSSEYEMKLNNYLKANEHLSNLDDFVIRDNYLTSAVFENNIKIAFHLRNDVRFMHFYNKLNNLNFLGFPNNHNMVIQAMYEAYIASDFNQISRDEFSKIDYSLIDGDIIDDIKFYGLLAEIEICKDDLNILKEVFDKFVINEPYLIKKANFVALLAYASYLINEYSYYEKLDTIYKESGIELRNTQEIRFINFVLLYASTTTNDDFSEMVKNTCIVYLDQEQNYVYNDVIKNCYEHTLLVLNKYRDVCLLEKSIKSQHHIKDRRIYCMTNISF